MYQNISFLLESTQTIIPKNNNVDINIYVLLHGNTCRSFSYDLNIEIFQAVRKLISDARRFI
jgi:hypothetical protein